MKKYVICLLLCCSGVSHAQVGDSVVFNAALLVQADNMPTNYGQLITLPNQGLFIADDNTFYSLDKERCPEINKFRILEDIPFNQVIVNDNDFIVKSQQFLILLGEEQTEILAEFDTEDYALFSGNDSIINIVVQEDVDTCTWYKFDRKTGEIDCFMRQGEPIKKIVSGNHIDFCIIGNNIYYVSDNICGELVISKEPIIDVILLPNGIMFCTDKMLSFYDDNSVISVAEGDFHGLHHDGSIVYVVLKNGNIWRMEIK